MKTNLADNPNGDPIPVMLINWATKETICTFKSIKDCAMYLFRNPQKAKHLYVHIRKEKHKIKARKYHPGKFFQIKKIKE